MTSLTKPAILCIDDNQDNRDLLTFVFEDQGFSVSAFDSITESLLQAKNGNFRAIILDNRLGEKSGLDVCREIRWNDRMTPIIFYSGEVRQSEIDKALAAGANEYLIKPNDFDKLTETVSRLIQNSQTAE